MLVFQLLNTLLDNGHAFGVDKHFFGGGVCELGIHDPVPLALYRTEALLAIGFKDLCVNSVLLASIEGLQRAVNMHCQFIMDSKVSTYVGLPTFHFK